MDWYCCVDRIVILGVGNWSSDVGCECECDWFVDDEEEEEEVYIIFMMMMMRDWFMGIRNECYESELVSGGMV